MNGKISTESDSMNECLGEAAMGLHLLGEAGLVRMVEILRYPKDPEINPGGEYGIAFARGVVKEIVRMWPQAEGRLAELGIELRDSSSLKLH